MRSNSTSQKLFAIGTVLVALAISACEPRISNERWLLNWEFPTGEGSLFIIELVIQDGLVTGKVIEDGNEVTGRITGEVDGNVYSLLLHPAKYGDNLEHDLFYRGTRSGSTISGDWGMQSSGKIGVWTAAPTDSSFDDVLRELAASCGDKTLVASNPCNGAANSGT